MAEVLRNPLPSGYDEDFVNEVEEDFQCLICHLPLKEPVLTRCGHRFCKECLEEHFRRQMVQNQLLNCPADRKGLDQDRDVFPDLATERKILSFAIECPSEGCEWNGELRNKEVHLASCLFKLVPCTNENCVVAVERKDLEDHVTITCQWRIINCDHCSETHPECKMEDHITQCSKFPVSCPNNCGGSFPREIIPIHSKDDCPLTIISCHYEHMGCEIKVERELMEAHLQSAMTLHLDLACIKLIDTDSKLNVTEAKLSDTEAKLNATEAKLNDTEAKLNVTDAKLNDTETKLNDTEAKLNDTEAKLYDTEMKLDDTQDKLETTTKLVEEFNTRMFVWKIDNFSELLSQAKTGEKDCIESTPFYTVVRTGSYGYRLKVRIDPNGDGSGKNTHLSVFIFVLKGEYDAILPWPFKKKVKFTLIDQQEDPAQHLNVTLKFTPDSTQKCFARPTQEMNSSGWGYPKFITHEQLHSRRYLVDDTMFLQVEIGP